MSHLYLVLLYLNFICFSSAQTYHYQLDPWGNDSIRIRISPTSSIVDPPLAALLPTPPLFSTRILRTDQANVINGNLNVVIDTTTGLITATRVSDGKVLLQATKLVFGTPTVSGVRNGSVSTTLVFAGHGSSSRIYGLGEHRTGKVNQFPYYKNFSSSQDYDQSLGGDVSIPWYCTSDYGFLWNLPSYGSVNITADSITWFSLTSLNVDFWITTQSNTFDPKTTSPYNDLLYHYVDAVGHAPSLPFYASGFIQCKNRYRNQTQLLDIARGYVTRGLPISVIVIDAGHWVHQGDWSFNTACWPNVQGMVDELHTLGIELMVAVWPFQTNTSQHWQEFVSNNYLVKLQNGTLIPYDDGGQYLYDTTNAAARQAVWNGIMDGYAKYGIKTFWLDAAEPEHKGTGNDGHWQLTLGTDAELMEGWVQQHVRTYSDGLASIGIKGDEYFILPRSSWAGGWRYSAALWSGDITSSFDELALQIKVAQGVAMSGVALWTTDIGGYKNGNESDPVFQDLVVRWFQFGAFCPLFRLHGKRLGGPPSDECGVTNGDNEVWNLAPEAKHYAGIARIMELRENLRSYVMQINQVTSDTGLPMVRPMFLQWPLDSGCQASDVEDQFMFGPNWLVAPVTVYQATNRSVYLPLLNSNLTWIYFFNNTDFGPGGKRVTVATPIDEFPLFYWRASLAASTATEEVAR